MAARPGYGQPVRTVALLVVATGEPWWGAFTGPLRAGPFATVADGLLGALAVATLLASLNARKRGTAGLGWWRAASVLAGLFFLFVSLGSGLARHEGEPAVDVVVHVLLMMMAPPLLVLGRPLGAWTGCLAASATGRWLRQTGRTVSGVVTWPLYYGSMAAYFLTAAYPASLAHPALLDLTQVAFIAVGLLFWSGLVGARRSGVPRSRGYRIAAVAAGMPAETALGLAITVWPRPLSPGQSLAAVHAAGLLLWVACMTIGGIALGVILLEWYLFEAHQDDRAGYELFFDALSPDGDGAPTRPSLRARSPLRT